MSQYSHCALNILMKVLDHDQSQRIIRDRLNAAKIKESVALMQFQSFESRKQ